MKAKYFLNYILGKFGYILTKKQKKLIPIDLLDDAVFLNAYKRCRPYTKIQPEGVYSFWDITQYVTKKKIPGAIVECGVWKGGGIMASSLQLCRLGETQRKIYLYDTFKGMSEPTDKDVNSKNHGAIVRWKKEQRDGYNTWDYGPLEEVKKNVFSTGYPQENFIFVEGRVEDTIPKVIPDQIAILRIDTDWYESTKHVMRRLFPRLVRGGFLILDDYGTWRGARQAVDEYFKENNISMLLYRVDRTGARAGVKI